VTGVTKNKLKISRQVFQEWGNFWEREEKICLEIYDLSSFISFFSKL
tara:strand:- start:397 stop:537 length:141 start_codon:yes stop_codon:yes gene_type:complete